MNIHQSFLAALSFVICFSCEEKDEFVRDYPSVLSTEITSVDETGVVVSVNITEAHMDQIIDHGLVWAQRERPAYDYDFSLSLGKPGSTAFVGDIEARLVPERSYYVRAYLKTNNRIIYGVSTNFISKGCQDPTIESVSPEFVNPLDELTIIGEGFAASKIGLEVLLRTSVKDYKASLLTVTETTIVALAPKIDEGTPSTEAHLVLRFDDGLEVISSTVLIF